MEKNMKNSYTVQHHFAVQWKLNTILQIKYSETNV